MKRIAVYIATTGGLVQVERITPERAPQSMMCLRRSSTILPISGDYDDFVRPGSGVIEREFGPFEDESFRLDVSAPIGAGNSWQLGVFVAHAIAGSDGCTMAADSLACDEIVILTGRVDYDLNIESVDHIPEKLAGLAGIVRQAPDCPVRLIVPAGRNHDTASREALPAGVSLVAAASAWDACRAIGLDVPSNAQDVLVPAPGKPPARWRWGLTALAGLAVTGALVVVYADPDRVGDLPGWTQAAVAFFSGETRTTAATASQTTASTAVRGGASNPSDAAVLRVLAQRPPAGGNCADIQFGGAAATLEPIAMTAQGELAASRLDAICGLAFEVAATGPDRHVALLLHMRSGKRVRGEPPPSSLRGEVPLSGVVSWSITLPRRLSEPFAYQLTVLESELPVAAEAETLRGQVVDEAAAKRLTAKGIEVQTIDHKVMN